MNSFNSNLKKQRETVTNHISSKFKNTNQNKDIKELIKLKELKELINLKTLCTNNSIIRCLTINSLGNKIIQLREVCKKTPINLLCIDETKIDASFPDAQFHIKDYQYPPFRQRLDKNGGQKWLLLGNV